MCRKSSLILFSLMWILLAGTAGAVTDTFVASGTWVAPAGVTSVDVEVWGGGGAGGGNPTTTDGGGGGGGGGYSKTTTIAVTPGNSYTVTVGAGGIAATGVAGGAGGDSWFSTAGTILARGGAGGAAATTAGGAGGAGGAAASGIGTTKYSGGNGGEGRNSNTGRGGPGGSSAGTGANGTSGPTPWTTATAGAPPAGGGIGGNGGNANRQDGFAPASGNGGGGGGGAERNTAGGNGADGLVTITYTPPAAVLSINTASANPTIAASVSWTVTFNVSVTGVNSGNFSLVNSGLGGTPAITSIAGSGTTWTVTASTGTGTGTLGLNMTGTSGVSPAITGLPFTGQVYSVRPLSVTANPTLCVNDASIGVPTGFWTGLTNVGTQDNVYAQASVANSDITNYLKCTGYGFSIPAGAVITGITVGPWLNATFTMTDNAMQLVKGGTIQPANLATGATIPNGGGVLAPSPTQFIYGGGTNLWGNTWTAADINSANFGAAFAAQRGGFASTQQAAVDAMPITVDYTLPVNAVLSIDRADADPTVAASVSWTVTFGTNVTGVSSANFTLVNTGLGGAPAITSVTGGPVIWTVTSSTGTGTGTLGLDMTNTTGVSPAMTNLPFTGQVYSVRPPTPVVYYHDTTNGVNIGVDGPTNVQSGTNVTIPPIITASLTTANTCTGDARTQNHPAGLYTHSRWYLNTAYAVATNIGANPGGSALIRARRNTDTVIVSLYDYDPVSGAKALIGSSPAITLTGGGGTTAYPYTITSPLYTVPVGHRLMLQYDFNQNAGGDRARVYCSATSSYITVTETAFPPPLPTPGSFNAFETSTTAGSITGVIKTKVSGSAFSLDVVAISAGTQLVAFNNNVKVELLGNTTLGVPLDAQNCPTSSSVVQTIASAAITGGRSTVNFAAVANAWRDVRVRISYPTVAPTVISCSTDNFAIRPSAFTAFGVSDTDRTTAGTVRTLNETTFGAVVHNAGRPFSVRANAVNAAGTPAITTNYTGAPTATLTACAGAACTATFGALSLNTTFVSGQLTSDVATYDNAGSLSLQLVDSGFASVDSVDSTALERTITSSVINVGRFVPDHFAVLNNTPAFGTACSGGGFGYVGQTFSYITVPIITLQAQNFANAATTLYAGSWWRVTSGSLTGKAYTVASGALDTSGITGADPVINDAGAGSGTLTFGSGSGLFFTRTTPVVPFDADLSLAINVIDADGVAYASNPARFGTATAGNGIAFSDGNALTTNDKQMRFGRLRISNANGSQLLPLNVQMQAQYWDSTGAGNSFITNTADSCTTLAAANIALGNYQNNLNACETSITVGSFASGRSAVGLSAPGNGNNGSVDLTVNLGAGGSGTTCIAGVATPVTGANHAYLQGNWSGGAYDQNPIARAAFGVSRGAEETIYIRENF